MKPLLVSSGEPAGIGPDICLSLAELDLPLVILGDKSVLAARAAELNLSVQLIDYDKKNSVLTNTNQLVVYSIPCNSPVIRGQLNPANAAYVINMLTLATDRCLLGEFSGLVTAPVHKAIINQAGISFTGHTEFLAQQCNSHTVVMMLASEAMKVALVTTHLPLSKVPDAVTIPLVIDVIKQLNLSLKQDFGIAAPTILVAGLNPHAGENGYLGREEIEVIQPALALLQQQGINAIGPFPADTLFTPKNLKKADVFVAMYHDQGLSVLKYSGFGQAVNITLGLPIIRTSVDHGTALELAGTGQAETGSMFSAVQMAYYMAKERFSRAKN